MSDYIEENKDMNNKSQEFGVLEDDFTEENAEADDTTGVGPAEMEPLEAPGLDETDGAGHENAEEPAIDDQASESLNDFQVKDIPEEESSISETRDDDYQVESAGETDDFVDKGPADDSLSDKDQDELDLQMEAPESSLPEKEEVTEEPIIEEEIIDDDESFQTDSLGEVHLIDYEALLKTDDLEGLAMKMTEEILGQDDFMRKDVLDKFIDFAFFKAQTGEVDIPNMAYPTKRMRDLDLEKKIIDLINIHLYPEIIFRLLKFFTRNIHDSDTNLHIANIIYSEDIIKAIYDTYRMLKGDIFIADPNKRTLNVKRIQQFSSRAENRFSSPLDTSARLKYILEFIALKQDVEHIYTQEDIMLAKKEVSEQAAALSFKFESGNFFYNAVFGSIYLI